MPSPSRSKVAGALGALAALLGLGHVVGWLVGWSVLADPSPGFIPMAPNSAGAFLLLGGTVSWAALRPDLRQARLALGTAAAVVGILSIATLVAAAAGYTAAFDRLLFSTSLQFGSVPLAAMSPVTALSFLLVTTGIIAFASRARAANSVAGSLGLASALIGAIVGLGYMFGSPLLYGTETIPVALTSALGFMSLGSAIVAAAGPEAWPQRPLIGSSPSARMLRAFLPALLVFVVALEWVEARLIAVEGMNRALVTGYAVLAAVIFMTFVVSRISTHIGATLERAAAERQAALEMTDRLERQNAMLLNAAAEGVLALDQEARITFVNPAAARMLGWSRAELVGMPFHETVQHSRPGGSPLPRSASRILAAVGGGQATHLEQEFLCTRSGETLPVEVRASPLADGGAVLTFNDIRQRIELQQQFLQAQKMEAMGLLAGGVAHDFNNLLTALRVSAELAHESIAPDHPAHQELTEIRSTIERAADLTTRLLGFGRKGEEAGNCDAADALRSIEPVLRRVLPRSIALVVAPGPKPLPVRLGTNSVEQALLNLVVNARDAMPRGGTLTLSAESYDDATLGQCARVTVQDSGEGMNETTRARIFEPFFTTKPEGAGTGLGLSMVSGLVDRGGGRIELETAPGAGTTITLLLPLASRGEAAESTVLLIEDEAAVRSAVTRILERAGYRVLASADGEDAIRTATNYPGRIDVVLTDTFLPRMPFAEVASRISAARPEARLIRMSGYPAEMREQLGVAAADTPFLAKPFTREELLAKVESILAGRPLQ